MYSFILIGFSHKWQRFCLYRILFALLRLKVYIFVQHSIHATQLFSFECSHSCSFTLFLSSAPTRWLKATHLEEAVWPLCNKTFPFISSDVGSFRIYIVSCTLCVVYHRKFYVVWLFSCDNSLDWISQLIELVACLLLNRIILQSILCQMWKLQVQKSSKHQTNKHTM